MTENLFAQYCRADARNKAKQYLHKEAFSDIVADKGTVRPAVAAARPQQWNHR
jgi:hypothetical protein